MSENVKESKKRDVFICEYETDKRPIDVDGKINLKVDVAWLEKRWAYGAKKTTSIIIPGYQLVIHTNDRLDDNYSFTWTIGTNFKRNFRRCGYSCVITDFDSLPKDTETWEIQEGRSFSTGSSKTIIGHLNLKKKL